jgi:hypothetical protein
MVTKLAYGNANATRPKKSTPWGIVRDAEGVLRLLSAN